MFEFFAVKLDTPALIAIPKKRKCLAALWAIVRSVSDLNSGTREGIGRQLPNEVNRHFDGSTLGENLAGLPRHAA